MKKIGDGVLETRFQFLSLPPPPADNSKWVSILDVMNQQDTKQDINYTLVQLWMRHTPYHGVQKIKFQCYGLNNDHSAITTLPDTHTHTNVTLQYFLQLRIGCTHLYFDIVQEKAYSLSFTRSMWASKQPLLKQQVSHVHCNCLSVILVLQLIIKAGIYKKNCWLHHRISCILERYSL